MKNRDLPERVFSIKNEAEFEKLALEIFHKQAQELDVYRNFLKHLHVDPRQINSTVDIPFLPIEFFKSQKVTWPSDQSPEIIFSSSGTTGVQTSNHYVFDLNWYTSSFVNAFKRFYGDPKDLTILALLPSYQEREGSSLIFMADELIQMSQIQNKESGYFLRDELGLYQKLLSLKATGKKTLLIGVTYALLDFIEQFPIEFPDLIVMETGGMKGRRKEMIREEVHDALTKGFSVQKIHSEYGMTELLSQAYSDGKGIFQSPPWMRISIRDVYDHFHRLPAGKTGGVNVIDLANFHSCSFLSTQDLGKWHVADKDQIHPKFEIIGRFDHSDIRGCNLLLG